MRGDGSLGAGPRPVVLVLMGASWRGHPAAGPIQGLKAAVEALSGAIDFRIVAAPGTLGEPARCAPWQDWHAMDRAMCSWLDGGWGRLPGLMRLIRRTPHDVLALHSLFDREFTVPALVLRRLGVIPRRPTILAPHGELSRGALAFKRRRKRAYLALARRLGLFEGLVLHASSNEEARDIRKTLPAARIVVAPGVRRLAALPAHAPRRDGPLRIAFLSRIDRMKNLDFALAVLRSVHTPVWFDILGPVTHVDYWQECARALSSLPSHVTVRYAGPVPHDAVVRTLATYDLFFLPTRGENFGHAIFDALEAGVPALISDRTPWRDLERHDAGWCLPLEEPEAFVCAIERFAAMSEAERNILRAGARRLAERKVIEDRAVARTRDMFLAMVGACDGAHPEQRLAHA